MGRLIDADDVKKMISDTFEKEKDVINSFWKMGTLMDKASPRTSTSSSQQLWKTS